jgi:hypothetical protein
MQRLAADESRSTRIESNGPKFAYIFAKSESCTGGAVGRLHVKAHMFNVARFVDAHQALSEGFDLVS